MKRTVLHGRKDLGYGVDLLLQVLHCGFFHINLDSSYSAGMSETNGRHFPQICDDGESVSIADINRGVCNRASEFESGTPGLPHPLR